MKVLVSSGAQIFSAFASSTGVYTVRDVSIKSRGRSEISVRAVDAAGNESPALTVPVVYNNPPQIRFLNPRADRAINGAQPLSWLISDSDGDQIKSAVLSYRRSGQPFRVLAKNPVTDSFAWDISALPDSGGYELKLEANDGTAESSRTVAFSIDRGAPEVRFDPLAKTVFTKKSILRGSGTASDGFSGVEFVEYSISDPSVIETDRHWFKSTINYGLLARDAGYSFQQPFALEDGVYDVGVRAVDAAGNISSAEFQRIIVDTSAPRIGSFIISNDNLSLHPSGSHFQAPAGADLKLLISLESDTKEARLNIGGEILNLVRNKASGLWTAEFSRGAAAEPAEIKVSASDELGNATKEKSIGSLEIINPGRISSVGQPVAGARLSVYVYDPERQVFVPWTNEAYEKEGAALTDNDGFYRLALPAGRYKLLAQKSGFVRARSSEFVLSDTRFVNFNFELEPRTGFKGFIENIVDIFSQ